MSDNFKYSNIKTYREESPPDARQMEQHQGAIKQYLLNKLENSDPGRIYYLEEHNIAGITKEDLEKLGYYKHKSYVKVTEIWKKGSNT